MADGIDFPAPAPKPAAQSLPVLAFDAAEGNWGPVDSGASEGLSRSKLSCATFNAWFQGPDAKVRNGGLLGVLQRSGADVIFLQEATIGLLEALLATDWIRLEYRVARAPFRDDAVPSHGVMLLSRVPVWSATLHRIPTSMGRALLTVESRLNGGRFVFATVHLDSMKGHADTRIEQLQIIWSILDPAENVLLAGDFNFPSSSPENARLDPRYTDLWPALRSGEPGFTQDTDVNVMLARAKREIKKERIDRIFLRSESGQWRPERIRLLGTEPVEPGSRIFPSDHFGLEAALSLAGATAL